jgi:hypothetical protein
MTIVLSFDIDGTLEVGDPPGGITIDMVRRAHALGYVVGSCSDRPLSAQRAMWERHGISVAFVAVKPQLIGLRDTIQADAYYHIGDSDVDQQYAKRAGFDFWWTHEGVTEPWLLLLGDLPPAGIAQ